MNKYRYLLKNVGLLTISNMGTKVLSIFLIPLYTAVLSTQEYGMYDFYSTTVSLMAPILTLTIVNGVMRFCLDDNYNKAEVFSAGVSQEIEATIIFIVFVLLNFKLNIIPILTYYPCYLILLFLSLRCYTFLSQFSRGVSDIQALAISGAINAVALFSLNILFLISFKMGLEGYFLANIVAYLIPSGYLLIRLKTWKYFQLGINRKIKQELLNYSKPMVFSSIGWWVNNVSDRYIVTWLCGVASNGIYSVAYKIPSIMNIFQNIFNQAWALSAVREIDKNSGEFYSKIYKVYNCGMVLLCSLMISCDQLIASILFSKEFYKAWEYAPFLMISTVFGALIGLLEGVFIATKQTGIIAKTTCIGAAVNILLNVILIYNFGTIGAAIATMISYSIVWITRYIKANEIIKLSIRIRRDIFSYMLLCIQTLLLLNGVKLWRVEVVQLFAFCIISLLYLDDLKMWVRPLNKVNS